jgi:hypothetical protein
MTVLDELAYIERIRRKPVTTWSSNDSPAVNEFKRILGGANG